MADVRVAHSPEPEGALVLDPEYSERQYYREPLTGYKREVWRPGDSDGSQSTDYYMRTGPALPMDQRWRLFQSNIGPMGLGRGKSVPPRYVFLDDRAVYEVLTSDIQRARLTREWPHDFSASGKVRARRTHCGRPAIRDRLQGEYHSAPITKTVKYVFTGEKDYKPIIYQIPPPQALESTVDELLRKRKAEDAADPALYNARAHGHNQHTPKDMMVKHGAPTFSRKKAKGDGAEILAMLKSQTPKLEKTLHAESAGRDSVPRAESVHSRRGSGVSQMVGNVVYTTSTAVSTTEAAIRPSLSPSQHQEEDDESDSDTELFPKPDTSHHRAFTPAMTASSRTRAPRRFCSTDRRAHEQALASDIMNAVENQDDVVRIASELAEANVALTDQAKEIERLKKALEESRSVVQGMRSEARGQDA